MTYDDFIHYIRQPETLKDCQPEELKKLADKYPYFKLSKWLYLNSLHKTGSVYFGQELKKTALYAADRRNLYFYIHPDESAVPEPSVLRSDNAGSYFDMIGRLDTKTENSRMSLQTLAEKLKAARETLKTTTAQTHGDIPTRPESVEQKAEPNQSEVFEEKEKQAKQLIREKKYAEAVKILEELNLINPKKSIYFADQIRFLKKIIQNQQ